MNTNNIHTYALHGLGLQEQDECRVGGFTGNCLGSRATVYQLTAIDKNMFFFPLTKFFFIVQCIWSNKLLQIMVWALSVWGHLFELLFFVSQ